MFRRLLLALCAAVLSLPAVSAAEQRDGIEDIATELAYLHCPAYLDGSLVLTDSAELRALGFTGARQTRPNAGFGQIEFVSIQRPEGEISFGGVPGKVCHVNPFSPRAAEIRTQLYAGITMLAGDFEPDPANSKKLANGTAVETFKAQVSPDSVLRVQLVDAVVQGAPMTGFQLFYMDR